VPYAREAMFNRYRTVLSYPGALRFSITAFVARLPISVETLGIVLLVTGLSESYGLAGALSATYTIANGFCAILQGRVLDRFGQSTVLPIASTLFAAGVAGLIATLESGGPDALAYLCAAVAGASYPPIGSVVRTRWSYVLAGHPTEIQTAYALESVVDEVIFIVGPTLATVLATQWHPWSALALALVTGWFGSLALAVQRSTEPVPQRARHDAGPRPAMPWLPVIMLAAVSFALGSMFAAAEVSTVAFSAEQNAKPYAGVLLAAWALGSAISGLLTGTIRWTWSSAERVRIGAIVLALVMVPLSFVGSMVGMGIALFVAGFAIAPTLIATLTAVEQTVPGPRLTEGIAIIHTGLAAGLAPGAALAGLVIDADGASASYLVALGGGITAALIGLWVPRLVPTRSPATVAAS
jgi:Major Facilitator Superfamily